LGEYETFHGGARETHYSEKTELIAIGVCVLKKYRFHKLTCPDHVKSWPDKLALYLSSHGDKLRVMDPSYKTPKKLATWKCSEVRRTVGIVMEEKKARKTFGDDDDSSGDDDGDGEQTGEWAPSATIEPYLYNY
jgi:hypothetical protein